jgi:hypothetical protein
VGEAIGSSLLPEGGNFGITPLAPPNKDRKMADIAEMEKRHAAFYSRALKGMTYSGIAIAVLLAVMAATLV